MMTENEKAARALEGFIQLLYWGDDITSKESEKNLEDSLIELLHNCAHSSNGLLLTDDGYFLTAKHCINPTDPSPYVKLPTSRIYNFEKICCRGKSGDILLAKADVYGECKPRRYKLGIPRKVNNLSVKWMTRREGRVYTGFGIIRRETKHETAMASDNTVVQLKNYWKIELSENMPGDSGGILLSHDNRLLGFLCAVELSQKEATYAIKLFKALELVSVYCNHLKKKAEK